MRELVIRYRGQVRNTSSEAMMTRADSEQVQPTRLVSLPEESFTFKELSIPALNLQIEPDTRIAMCLDLRHGVGWPE